jgi:hypothetical protein
MRGVMKNDASRLATSATMLLPLCASALVACGSASGPSAVEAEVEPLVGTHFERVWTCTGAVVDVDADERRNLQIVVTDPAALSLLSDRRLIAIPFGATEYVLRGDTRSAMDFGVGTGPKLQHVEGRGVFAPGDFDDFVHDETGLLNRTLVGRLQTVYRHGSDVTLQFATINAHGCAGKIVTSTSCGGEGGGSCPHSFCDGDDFTSFDVAQEYVFHGCL